MSQTCLKCLKCLCLVNLLKGPWQWQHLIVVLDKQVPVVAPTQSVSVQIWQQQHLPNSCPWGLPGHWAFCYELRSPLPKVGSHLLLQFHGQGEAPSAGWNASSAAKRGNPAWHKLLPGCPILWWWNRQMTSLKKVRSYFQCQKHKEMQWYLVNHVQ